MSHWSDGPAVVTAFLGFDDIKELLFFLLRVGVALVGAFLGWLVSGPLVRLLVRLAFHRPASPLVLRFGRLAGAVLAGLLVYYFFHLGSGGSGGGIGGGIGQGQGSQAGNNGSTPDKNPDKSARDRSTEDTQPQPAKEKLAIEIILSKHYKGDDRYYLLQGKEPAQTLKEVEDYLAKRRKKLELVEIIVYANSVAAAKPPVKDLVKLLDSYKVPRTMPTEYRKKRKQ
jgi:hypothetical protein